MVYSLPEYFAQFRNEFACEKKPGWWTLN